MNQSSYILILYQKFRECLRLAKKLFIADLCYEDVFWQLMALMLSIFSRFISYDDLPKVEQI